MNLNFVRNGNINLANKQLVLVDKKKIVYISDPKNGSYTVTSGEVVDPNEVVENSSVWYVN